MSDNSKKVGIIGGTFDPIHMGHLIVAETAREAYNLDEVLFIPSGVSYMKSNVLDKKTRVTMTGIAIESNPHFALSTIEVDRDGNSYSYETIEELKRHNPDTEYYFIVGADSLFDMEKWMHPEKIFSECIILAAIRTGNTEEEFAEQIKYLTDLYHADIRLIPTKSLDISSTDLRNKVANGQSIQYLVPYKVKDYIEKNNIYKQDVQ